jgi:hypothetical protein
MKDENDLIILERRILKRIYGQIRENGIWRSSYNHELYNYIMNQIQWK